MRKIRITAELTPAEEGGYLPYDRNFRIHKEAEEKAP